MFLIRSQGRLNTWDKWTLARGRAIRVSTSIEPQSKAYFLARGTQQYISLSRYFQLRDTPQVGGWMDGTNICTHARNYYLYFCVKIYPSYRLCFYFICLSRYLSVCLSVCRFGCDKYRYQIDNNIKYYYYLLSFTRYINTNHVVTVAMGGIPPLCRGYFPDRSTSIYRYDSRGCMLEMHCDRIMTGVVITLSTHAHTHAHTYKQPNTRTQTHIHI